MLGWALRIQRCKDTDPALDQTEQVEESGFNIQIPRQKRAVMEMVGLIQLGGSGKFPRVGGLSRLCTSGGRGGGKEGPSRALQE